MAEITVNLIHEMVAKRGQKKPKPPFIFGLRTGYVRAWVFVVLKVWLIAALLNGVNTMDRIEKNITLLDSLITNDFSHPEIFFDNQPQATLQMQTARHRKVSENEFYPPRVAGDSTTEAIVFEPRGPSIP